MTRTIASLGWVVVAGACAFALPSASHAQRAQTAEGAQGFLAAMAKRGFVRATFVDASGRANHLTGVHQVKTTRVKLSIKEEESTKAVERSLGELVVTELASGDAQGAADACSTRIGGFQPPAGLFEVKSGHWDEPGFLTPVTVIQTESWNYLESFQALAGPHLIDWRQAKVVRSNDGSRIDVSAKGQKFPTNILSFVPGDSELADRIEYAAKFLRLSCDEVAETGF